MAITRATLETLNDALRERKAQAAAVTPAVVSKERN